MAQQQSVMVPKFILVTIKAQWGVNSWEHCVPLKHYVNALGIRRIGGIGDRDGCTVRLDDGKLLWLSESAGDVIDLIEKPNEPA